jgi:DNA-binding LytR/AlgR family response regulator
MIIDDEPLAVELLAGFVSKIPYLELKKKSENAIEALEYYQKHPVDLVFVDIQMPDISGIELLAKLSPCPLVIFTTAYAEYALEGFELEAVDYLVKPFLFDRFAKATEKARLRSAYSLPSEPVQNHIFIRSGYETIKLNYTEIRLIEALRDYVQIHTDSKRITSLNSMKQILDLLPKEHFVRVHRSYIVPLNRITAYNSNFVTVGTQKIPIGPSFRKDVLGRLSSQSARA